MIEGFEIIRASDKLKDLEQYRSKGALRGDSVGFQCVDKHYTMAQGVCTDWTGYPRSGKTQVLMEFLINTATRYGRKHMVYFPDVGNEVEVIADLIHKMTGKTFDKDKGHKWGNYISQAEIARWLPWVENHFLIITKKDVKAKLTPYELWDWATDKAGEGDCHTVSVDSWKDLRHETRGYAREDKYLEDVLSYRNDVAERTGLHIHTIIHPKLPTLDKDGKLPVPTPFVLKGGSEWFNSGRCMVSVHRESMEQANVDLYFQKIKPRSVGEIGAVNLGFDLGKFRYYEFINGEKIFSGDPVPRSFEDIMDSDPDTDLPF